MDPLRYNCSQLYESPFYIGILLVFETIPFLHFMSPFYFPTEIHLSLNRVPKEKKIICAGHLNRSIGLEENRWKAKGVW
jgi:hypothetical protein